MQSCVVCEMPANKFKRVLPLVEGWLEYYPTLNLCSHNVFGQGCTVLAGEDKDIAIAWCMRYGYWY